MSWLSRSTCSKQRALWNGIVGNQKRSADGGGASSYIYMLPLGGVATKSGGRR